MLTLIFGIPGVGKTTVLSELSKLVPDVKIEKFGSIELRIAQQKGLVEDRDGLRMLHIDVQKELQSEAVVEIDKMHEEHKHLVIDTHAAVRTTHGYWPGFNEKLLK